MSSQTQKSDFDTQSFNAEFEKDKLERKIAEDKAMREKLEELSKKEKVVPIYEYSIAQTLVAIKDSWFDMLDDILQYNFSRELVTKDYRLYFIGITLIIVSVLLYTYTILTKTPKIEKPCCPPPRFADSYGAKEEIRQIVKEVMESKPGS